MSSRTRSVASATHTLLGLCISGLASASAAEPSDDLPTIYVSATAMKEDPQKIASSFSVLEGDALFGRAQATLGDTLAALPGVNVDSFGGGSARPVIRGQTAPRVTVLSDSAALLDASDISPDHAVTAEPLLVDRVEVLRGPAALLYGSGAIGGVVNLLDRKIATRMPDDGLAGSVALRGGTSAREKAAAAEFTAALGSRFAMHMEGTSREADDYRVRGGEAPRVDGTYASSDGVSTGMSWLGSRGYLGLAYSWREDGYGLPGHAHEYAACQPLGSRLVCDEHEHEHDHESPPAIALRSQRWDLRGELDAPLARIERIRLRAAHTDYRHFELDDEEIGTTFLNNGNEARIEIQHGTFAGWRGVVGAQFTEKDFRSSGEEVFLPSVSSRATGVFAVEHYEVGEVLHFEVGARREWQKHRPVDDVRGGSSFSGSANSLSAAAVWEFVSDSYVTLSLARSERLPHAQELYARGVHLATNTYECGLALNPLPCGGVVLNAGSRTETSKNIELAYRRTAGALTLGFNGYVNHIDHYIYARTLDRFEDFRLVRYSQADARFRGAEAEVTWRFTPGLAATLFGDFVRATFDDGGNLPRIPAARIGTRLTAGWGRAGAALEYTHVRTQDDIAEYESITEGRDMLDLTLSYSVDGGSAVSLYLRGGNLLDERAFNHASFLATSVPLPGRNFAAGVRFVF